jgi:fatty-acyl-CoA synthase
MNIAWWVKRWSDLHPNKPAIIFEEKQISYADLYCRAKKATCWLLSLGIGKSDRVAVMLQNGVEFIELYLACSCLGAIFVPINSRLSPPELDYLLRNSEPRLLVFGDNSAKAVQAIDLKRNKTPPLLACVGTKARSSEALDYGSCIQSCEGRTDICEELLARVDSEEPQSIMYTSGTTGDPKGAVLSFRKTFFNCLNADIFLKLKFEDVVLIVLPLFHSGGLFIQASPCIYKGATMIIHPKFDAQRVYKDIERYKVTKFLAVPTVFNRLLEVKASERGDLSSLEVCAIGGEKTTPEIIGRCWESGFRLRQIMGQTETSILLCSSEEESLHKPRSVGRPVFYSEVDLVDEKGRAVGPNEVGEIIARGSILMTSYWRDAARTVETVKDGWLHTGDLARRDDEGYFYLVDRAKDMYISGGENVYPAEIERVLREHPGIEDVAIVGVSDQTWGEVGHAFVIRKAGSELRTEDLISFCEGRVAHYKWPKKITFCKAFPRTSLGKVRKRLLLSENWQANVGSYEEVES